LDAWVENEAVDDAKAVEGSGVDVSDGDRPILV
jgi:hypothetical protein